MWSDQSNYSTLARVNREPWRWKEADDPAESIKFDEDVS